MAIRLREVDGHRVALCAVETDPMPGDVYLDDAWHTALQNKFMHDWTGSGLIPGGQCERDPVAAGQKLRDAAEEHARWEGERRETP